MRFEPSSIRTTADWWSRAPFGRRPLVEAMAATLFGLATRTFVPGGVAASHLDPSPCYGASRCHSCSGTTCTSNCARLSPGDRNCNGVAGKECWVSYTRYNDTCYNAYDCCDWDDLNNRDNPNTQGWNEGICICRRYRGRVCSSAAAAAHDEQRSRLRQQPQPRDGTEPRRRARRSRRDEQDRAGPGGETPSKTSPLNPPLAGSGEKACRGEASPEVQRAVGKPR